MVAVVPVLDGFYAQGMPFSFNSFPRVVLNPSVFVSGALCFRMIQVGFGLIFIL